MSWSADFAQLWGTTPWNRRSRTPGARVFSMLAAVTGMHLKAQEPNEPFGPMVVWAEGRRTAALGDFRGEPVEVLAQMAAGAENPVLQARLADVCWLLERKRAQLGITAISAYVEILKQVDSGALKFQYDKEPGALKIDVRNLLRRALSIARAMGSDQTAGSAARTMAANLRVRSFEDRSPIPACGSDTRIWILGFPIRAWSGKRSRHLLPVWQAAPMVTPLSISGGWRHGLSIWPRRTATSTGLNPRLRSSSFELPGNSRWRC